jgi:hypothetical protein
MYWQVSQLNVGSLVWHGVAGGRGLRRRLKRDALRFCHSEADGQFKEPGVNLQSA